MKVILGKGRCDVAKGIFNFNAKVSAIGAFNNRTNVY
jgi:hypothetical protein